MVVLLLIVVCLLLGAKAEAGVLDGRAVDDVVQWEPVPLSGVGGAGGLSG